jgi:hypothetical protein
MLDLVGHCTVHVQKSTYNTVHATLAMTAGTASRKGAGATGNFQRSLQWVHGSAPYFNNDIMYLCEANTWMDVAAMLVCTEQALCPHIETALPGVLPIHFFDSYQHHHMMSSVVGKIQD